MHCDGRNVRVACLLQIMKGCLVKLFDLIVFAVVMSPENSLEVALAGVGAAVSVTVSGVQLRLGRKVCLGRRAAPTGQFSSWVAYYA